VEILANPRNGVITETLKKIKKMSLEDIDSIEQYRARKRARLTETGGGIARAPADHLSDILKHTNFQNKMVHYAQKSLLPTGNNSKAVVPYGGGGQVATQGKGPDFGSIWGTVKSLNNWDTNAEKDLDMIAAGGRNPGWGGLGEFAGDLGLDIWNPIAEAKNAWRAAKWGFNAVQNMFGKRPAHSNAFTGALKRIRQSAAQPAVKRLLGTVANRAGYQVGRAIKRYRDSPYEYDQEMTPYMERRSYYGGNYRNGYSSDYGLWGPHFKKRRHYKKYYKKYSKKYYY
jgi:hypothetical protein